MRGAEQRIVAGGHPHLDREEDRVAVRADPLDHPPRRLGPVLPRHPVLHLGEAHAALVGEDPVAAIGRRAARGEPGSEARERGNRPRHRLAGGGYRLQRPVLEHDVVEEGGRPAARARRPLGAVAFQDERRVSVGKGEELEVLVRVGALLEALEDLLARSRAIDPVQGEGRDAAQGHRADRSQGADAHARRPQQLGIALRGQLANRAVGEDQLHRHHLRGDVAQLGAGAVGAGRDRAGNGLAIDVAEVLHRQAELVQPLVEVGEHRARPHLDQARGAIGLEHAAERAHVDHRPVGHRRLGERVTAARHADLAPRRHGGDDRPAQLLAIGRAHALDGSASLIAGPIAPGTHRPLPPRHRRHAPRA